MVLRTALAVCLTVTSTGAAHADYQRITSRQQFEQIVVDRELTRLGISLSVASSGQITGSAFTRNVTGKWSWQDGYFCRDLFWGEEAFGYNCQEVTVEGNSVRFTSDKGAGRSADLTVR